MIKRHRWTIALCGLWLFSLSHCGVAGFGQSSSASGGSGVVSTDEVVGGSVSELTSTTGGMSVSFSDLTDDEEIILLLYSFNESSSIQGFQLGSENAPESSYLISSLAEDETISTTEIEGVEDLTEELHGALRSFEEEIPMDATVAEQFAADGALRFATTGSQKNFKVLSSFSNSSSFETVTATLRYQNEDFEFYIDDRDESALTDAELEALADDFAALLPKEREFFGDESDVDGNGKFAVLFTQVVNKLGGSAGGIVTGFFYAIDLFDTSQYSNSNEMEVFYTFVPDPTGEYGSAVSKSFALTNILPGVLPHEFQHMINFNQHYFVNSGSSESGWLNEGLSHLAEDLYSLDGDDYMTASGLENPARVASYLSSISNICFTCGTSLSQRGGSYLFLRYLYEQAEKGEIFNASSGSDLIGNLVNTNRRSIDNVINAAFGSSGTDEDFKATLGLFSLAVYLSNSGLTDDERLNFEGINLRGLQDDNRGTVLTGPQVQNVSALPFTDTLTGTAVTYMKISGASLNANGGVLNLGFEDSADFDGFAIRR